MALYWNQNGKRQRRCDHTPHRTRRVKVWTNCFGRARIWQKKRMSDDLGKTIKSTKGQPVEIIGYPSLLRQVILLKLLNLKRQQGNG